MPFNKLLLLPALVLALGVGAAVAATTGGSSDPAGSAAVLDVKGPCDEAEHANDPECAGPQVPEDDDAGEVEDRDEDNSGPSASSGPSDDGDDDNSGPSDSSGSGSGGGGDDSSGSGGHSGPGGGGDDD
jgi:hypothetical protein